MKTVFGLAALLFVAVMMGHVGWVRFQGSTVARWDIKRSLVIDGRNSTTTLFNRKQNEAGPIRLDPSLNSMAAILSVTYEPQSTRDDYSVTLRDEKGVEIWQRQSSLPSSQKDSKSPTATDRTRLQVWQVEKAQNATFKMDFEHWDQVRFASLELRRNAATENVALVIGCFWAFWCPSPLGSNSSKPGPKIRFFRPIFATGNGNFKSQSRAKPPRFARAR